MICYAEQYNLKPARGKSGQPICVATLVGSFIGDNKMLDIMAIPLTQGLFALVDGKNYKRLNKNKWRALKGGRTYYAARNVQQNGKSKQVSMHREILGLLPGDSKLTDHINQCGLDNRALNIRVCTNRQNQGNAQLRIDNKSGYRGVSWCRKNKVWVVQIRDNGKVINLGHSKDKPEKLARIYDLAAKKLFGEFANLNFQQGGK